MAFSSAATVVVANQFNLVDPNGIIVAQLQTGTQPGVFPIAGPYSELAMLHNDVLTTDSTLRWSNPGTPGNEYVMLQGPADAAGGQDRPRIVLQDFAAETTARVASGSKSGAVPGAELALGSVGGATLRVQQANAVIDINNSGANGVIDIFTPAAAGTIFVEARGATGFVHLSAGAGAGGNNPSIDIDGTSKQISVSTSGNVELFDAVGVGRGRYRGTSFHTGAVGVSFNTLIATQIAVTLALPTAPVAGAMLDISWSADVISQIGGDTVSVDVLVNGVAQAPIAKKSEVGVGVRTSIANGCIVAAPIGAGFNVQLRVYSTINGGFQITQVDTILNVVYYR